MPARWEVAFRAWVEMNGLDPAELAKGSVSRGAFKMGWVAGRAVLASTLREKLAKVELEVESAVEA